MTRPIAPVNDMLDDICYTPLSDIPITCNKKEEEEEDMREDHIDTYNGGPY